MNKLVLRISMIVCLTGFFFSCTDKDEPFGAVLETDLEQLNFGVNEASKFVSVNANCIYSVSSPAGWCKAELVESMTENLKISVEQNTEIGRSRTTEVSIDAEGIESKKITVVQDGVPVVLSIVEKTIVLETEDEFSLEITANVLFTFELPDWIHEKSGNAPAVGTQTYYFILDALPAGESVRSGSMSVKAVDPEFNSTVAIPVRQGKDPVVDEGINKTTPCTIEAETSLEGLEAKQQAWWAESGTMFGSDYYISPNAESVTYAVHVADAANYDFRFVLACWGAGGVSMTIYVDDVEARTVSNIPVTDGTTATVVDVEGIALPAGDHVIKIHFNGYADFNKFTVTYNSAHVVQSGVTCTIEAESCLEGLEAKQQEWWVTSGTMFGSNYYIQTNSSVTYPVKVNDAGNYDFRFALANWGGTTFVLYIDDNAVSGTVSIPTSGGVNTTYINVGSVPLTTGNHTVKVTFSDWIDFDKFLIYQ